MYNNKLQYSWSDYDKDIKSIEWLSFDHVIGIFRGSIGMAAHISNKHSIPMSIVGLQTRDADDKYPYWILNNTKAEMVPNQEPETIFLAEEAILHLEDRIQNSQAHRLHQLISLLL